MILSMEFANTPMSFLDKALTQSKYRLFSAYRVLEEARKTWDPANPPYNKLKYSRKMNELYNDENLEGSIQALRQHAYEGPGMIELLNELKAARKLKKKADKKLEAERQHELEEEQNVLRAEAEGTMLECGCCFSDYPLNRMIHCNSETVLHWFCRNCAKQNAETEVGNSKYELKCMSVDGCTAGFSLNQR
jgi:TRIAD3 protein (E3 ubiquitin-protein ligase RNF216)